MEYLVQKGPLWKVIAPVAEGLGYSIVELSSRTVENRLHVILRVFSPEGVSLDSCADLHRLVLSRLEVFEGKRDISLEVSSPGLGRKMKYADELQVFKGRGVRYLMEGQREWISGVLGEVEDAMVEIQMGKGIQRIPISSIRKMRLDDTYEVRR